MPQPLSPSRGRQQVQAGKVITTHEANRAWSQELRVPRTSRLSLAMETARNNQLSLWSGELAWYYVRVCVDSYFFLLCFFDFAFSFISTLFLFFLLLLLLLLSLLLVLSLYVVVHHDCAR